MYSTGDLSMAVLGQGTYLPSQGKMFSLGKDFFPGRGALGGSPEGVPGQAMGLSQGASCTVGL